jgi:hypothetical protein
MDAAMKYTEDCKGVDASVELAASADALIVTVTADAGWKGGPIAAELPVPKAKVDAETGEDDKLGDGYATWATRSGVTVARCQFDPSTRPMKKGASASCAVPLLGLADGDHTLWITGFMGQVPGAENGFGTVPAGRGVVAMATPRSVEFKKEGTKVTVSKPSATDTDNPATQVISQADPAIDRPAGEGDGEEDGSSPVLPIAVGVGILAVVGVVAYRGRKAGEGGPGDTADS